MASPAITARLNASAQGFTEVLERGRGFLKTRNPNTGSICLDTSLGNIGWHYGTNWANEVDTAWETSADPAWQWQMIKAEYNTFSRNVLNAGDTIKYIHPNSGEYVIFQPLALNWVDNVTDSRQQITQPQAVTATLDGDIIKWIDGYGSGRHFQWQSQTARLQKLVTIDNLSDLPTPTVSNPYLEIEFIMKKSDGVTLYIDGNPWDNSTQVVTANRIEYRLNSNGQTVWYFDYPSAFDINSKVIGLFQLRRQGANRYCTVRIPKTWIDTATFPIHIDPTIDPIVGASGDDGFWEEEFNEMNADGVESQVGHNGLRPYYSFSRFTGISISGTVTTSYITLTASRNENGAPVLRVFAVDSDNPSAPSDGTDAKNRTLTTNYADWTLGNWTQDTEYNSPSLNAVFNELIASYTISSDAIMIFVRDNGSASGVYKHLYAYDGNTSKCAKLHVEYSTSTPIEGTTCWGHSTGVTETNTRTFASNWTGTGVIGSSGDTERLELDATEYMQSETVNTGIHTIILLQNNYSAGDTVTLKYRHGATQVACEAASWNTYSVPFDSLGYVQVRVESSL